MKTGTTHKAIAAVLGAAAVAAGASAAEIAVTADIATSTTWTKNNTYNLKNQVYVLPGATLTIEAGTVIASDVTASGSGALAVTRGARLVCEGTAAEPVIFTSKNDVATWTGGDPKTGTWRAAANEWGNLTIMGNAYIGKYNGGAPTGNTAAPNAANYMNMEGLVASGTTDTRTRYGGGDDLDNSGSLRYVSLRYGGRVVGLGSELNGLSLGGIGKNTDIDHVEIMNNVDDGIEIWGGTVDLKYVSIWNIGDDSFDIDQGWRGRAQFGLIVQGYSVVANSGSGFPDSMIEADGAEFSDAQPVTTAALYNFTLIGQPLATGRHAIKFRDNCNLQLRNSIVMDCPAEVIRNDNTDGEAANGGNTGYGYNGTLSFAARWTTPYTTTSTVNPFPSSPASRYQAQSSGNLIQFSDNVFFNNNNASAYNTGNANGLNGAANNNVFAAAGSSPIASIVRSSTAVTNGQGHVVQRVTSLDPRAANAAATSVGTAPNNGFFSAVQYRGAFGVTENWLCGWTAADAYGMNVAPPAGCGANTADLNSDGVVGGADLGILLGKWGQAGSGDLNSDGVIGGADLGILLGKWGTAG
jgi:hypothetical protein